MIAWLRNWWAKERRLRKLKPGETGCSRCGTAIQHKNASYIHEHGVPSPLSIYGPTGSYWLTLEHCPHCGWFWGKRYDTFGGGTITPVVARRAWLTERDGMLSEDVTGARGWLVDRPEGQKEQVPA